MTQLQPNIQFSERAARKVRDLLDGEGNDEQVLTEYTGKDY